jgi:uncharacterized damage-inducible protein DinB
MKLDELIDQWKDVRNGLIEEASLIPEDKFNFKASEESRSISELLQHIVQTQKVLVGEICRADTNFSRGFPALIAEHADGVTAMNDKEGLIELLRDSIEAAETKMRGFGGEALQVMTTRFDGKPISKISFLDFSMSHEMYHRGQLTVYERLLGIEPALTTRFKKLFATGG